MTQVELKALKRMLDMAEDWQTIARIVVNLAEENEKLKAENEELKKKLEG